jgi:hypothetical protein
VWDALRVTDCAVATSEPVAIVTASQPVASLGNAPNEIDPDTPPVVGIVTF